MITLYTILVFATIILQSFFTASEMALTTMSRIKLKELLDSGDPRAAKLNSFLSKEGVYLGTTLVGTNIAVVITSVLATRIFMEYFGSTMAPVLILMEMRILLSRLEAQERLLILQAHKLYPVEKLLAAPLLSAVRQPLRPLLKAITLLQ